MGVIISDMLKGVDLFSSLSDLQIEKMASLAVEKHYSRDEAIILEDDDENLALFLIAEGEVKVYMSGIDGRETILSLLGPGDFFGEMSLLDGEPRSASVRSVGKACVLVIRRDSFTQLLTQYPDLSATLLEEMSRRLRKANRQIGSLSTLTVMGRIAGTLVSLAEERGRRIHGENGKIVTVIENRPTQQHLAEMSGTTRETVSRVLNSLRKKGIISINGKDLIILQEDGLKGDS